MKTISLITIFLLMAIAEVGAQEIDPPINAKFSEIIDAEKIGTADIEWLEEQIQKGNIEECIATALLFRADREKNSDLFRAYFHLEKVNDPSVLSSDYVNEEVNRVIRRYRGRLPIEVASRVYLSFKGSNKVILRGESEIYLEMMFRASVFTGTIKPSKEELLKLSGLVDSPIQVSNK